MLIKIGACVCVCVSRCLIYYKMNKMVLICINGSCDGIASRIHLHSNEWMMMEASGDTETLRLKRKIAWRLKSSAMFHWRRESNKKIKSNFINVCCQMNSVCWMNIITIIINVCILIIYVYVAYPYVPSAKWAACTHSAPFELDFGRCESSCRSKDTPSARIPDRSWDAIVGQHVKLKLPAAMEVPHRPESRLSVHRFSIKYETKFSINNLIINKNIFHLCSRLNAALKLESHCVFITTSTSLLLSHTLSFSIHSSLSLRLTFSLIAGVCVLVLVKNHHSVRSSHECQHEFLISSQPRGVTWNDVMWCDVMFDVAHNDVQLCWNGR